MLDRGRLADARLITLSEDSAEVAHEALIREWPTLRQWLNENRAGLVLHRELADDTNRWQRLDRDAGALYRGAQLQQALDWSQKNPTMLSLSEQDFLDASRVQAAAEAERDRQLKRTVVLRRLVFPAIGVLLLGVLAGVSVLVWLWRRLLRR